MNPPAKKRKQHRLILVLVAISLLALATTLVLRAFDESIVFFISPTEGAEKNMPGGERFRLGGMVEEGSVESQEEGLITIFKVTDFNSSITVSYRGIVPDLFREGQGVVAEGRMDGNGVFVADTVLAKHDENYMPPEVAEMLENADGAKQ